jgi:site-specific DNA-adenine methylase
VRRFISLVGSKGKTATHITSLIRREGYDTYCEPMIGSGAVFFTLMPRNAIIGDREPLIANTYIQIKENVEEVKNHLLKMNPTKEFWRETRDSTLQMEGAEQAASFIFVMALSYQGVLRFRGDGSFTSPWGSGYKHWSNRLPRLLKTIEAASKLLRNKRIIMGDYSSTRGLADITFFDPPYYGSEATYRSVSTQAFDYKRFRDDLSEWYGRWILTINDLPETRDMYLPISEWHTEIRPYYSVCPIKENRGRREELIITNFRPRLYYG